MFKCFKIDFWVFLIRKFIETINFMMMEIFKTFYELTSKEGEAKKFVHVWSLSKWKKERKEEYDWNIFLNKIIPLTVSST